VTSTTPSRSVTYVARSQVPNLRVAIDVLGCGGASFFLCENSKHWHEQQLRVADGVLTT
jgi:hypothetical protein